MVADDDDVQSEDLDMHQITCALQIRKVERSMILVMPSMCAQSQRHA